MKPTATVLVVDDTPENLAVLFDVLGGAGFKVLVVESGEIALERMNVLLPDLILLDVHLPGANGFEVCSMLKESAEFADIPVIILTASNETADTVYGFAAGAVDYLCKPVEPEEVLARVRTHLKIRQLYKTLETRNRELSKEIRRRRAAERQLEQSLDIGLIVLSTSGKVEFATQLAWALLGRYYPDSNFGLPEDILQWSRQPNSQQRRIRRPEGELIVHMQAAGSPQESCLLKLEEHVAIHSPAPLEALGLTPREAEVLYWLAQGKSSPEIAAILSTATNTVKKHAQNIYQKLEVDNRTAAAIRALEMMQSISGTSSSPLP